MSAVLSQVRSNVSVMTLTPRDAQELLRGNKRNRPLNNSHIRRLADAMERGEWKLNYETVKVGKDGSLLDGQHRLNAIVLSNTPVAMAVAYGVDPETFDTIDVGRRRGGSDVLAIVGADDPVTVASGCRYAMGLNATQRGEAFNPATRRTNVEIVTYYESHRDIAKFVTAAKEAKLIPTGIALGALYVFSKIDEEKAVEFFERAADGAGLGQGSPILLLRETFLNSIAVNRKVPPETAAAWVVKMWNNFMTGKESIRLKYMATEAFPTIVGWKG